MRLTKRAVDAIKPGDREVYYWDSELRGFGVRVCPPSRRHPAGSKAYCVKYRTLSGQPRKLTLGAHGTLTPEQARNLAQAALAAARAGRDPSRERREGRAAPTVADLADRYEAMHLPKKKATSAVEDKRLLKAEIRPRFGKRRIADLTHAEVARWHAGKSKHPYAGNRALALLRAMLELAVEWGMRDEAQPNAAARVRRFREHRRQRFLTDDELTALGKALDAIESEKPGHRTAIAAIRVLALTGARKREVLDLRWDWIDWERRLAWLADSKTGARPLHLEAALEVIRDLPRESEFVFPSPRKRGAPLANVRATLEDVLKKAELEGVRVHDLRHTKASLAGGMGLSLPQIGALLGHRRASTTERYVHLVSDPIREADRRVQGRIAAALAGKPPAEVVELHESAE